MGVARPILLITLAVGMAWVSAGCEVGAVTPSEGLQVVTTTTLLADLTAVIGGDYVEVVSLMGAGVDPHVYQASAGDVTTLCNAQVIVYNGLQLEAAMGEVLAQVETQGQQVICLGDGLNRTGLIQTTSADTYDPHIWFDVGLWTEGAVYLAEQLSILDPDHATAYQDNLEQYIGELETLEAYIIDQVAMVPEGQRVVITAHDAFGYFGQAYGFTVMGVQGISTQSETSTAQMMMLATYIADNEIPAIFVETSVSSRNIQALQEAVEAMGFSVALGGELYSDALGDESSGHDSYITMVTANVDTIVRALTGGEA